MEPCLHLLRLGCAMKRKLSNLLRVHQKIKPSKEVKNSKKWHFSKLKKFGLRGNQTHRLLLLLLLLLTTFLLLRNWHFSHSENATDVFFFSSKKQLLRKIESWHFIPISGRWFAERIFWFWTKLNSSSWLPIVLQHAISSCSQDSPLAYLGFFEILKHIRSSLFT